MADVIIKLTWTKPSDTTGLTGYNLYRVQGAPIESTKTLVAFINDINTVSYLYTGTRGTQYQFELRATDGTNESEPIEIFLSRRHWHLYPDALDTHR